MQTFLPYPDFIKSAQCLDYKRLGKQRVQARQILNILLGETTKVGWRNHPCVKMWSGYEQTLKIYHDIMIQEWVNRGYNNTMTTYGKLYPKEAQAFYWQFEAYIPPIWLDDEFCSFHRSTLLWKNPEWYSQFGWTEEPKYEYLWPTKKTTKNINLEGIFEDFWILDFPKVPTECPSIQNLIGMDQDQGMNNEH